MMAAAYADVRHLAHKLAGFCGQKPEAAIRGDALRSEMAMRLRDGIRRRGGTHASLNVPRVWMNYVPSAERMLAADPMVLSRIALGYVPPMRLFSRAAP